MGYARIIGTPALRDPALVVAFTGWGDAGSAASSAALLLLRDRPLLWLADFDPEAFYVLADARPLVRETTEGRRVQWPSLGFLAGRSGGPERDLVLLVAAEPQLRWRTFSQAVAETWLALGGGPAILLGSFLADVQHVGPVPLVGSGSTPQLGSRLRALGVVPNRYEGPTAAIVPVYEALATREIGCVSLWAAIPHYLFRLPNPKATVALLRVVGHLLGVSLDLADLERAAATFEARLNLALAQADEAPSKPPTPPVPDLPTGEPAPMGSLPTAEEAVREVEHLLGLEPRGKDPGERPS